MPRGTARPRKRRAVVSSTSAEEEPVAEVTSSAVARRAPFPKKKQVVMKLDENGRAPLKLSICGVSSAKCTFCRAPAGDCMQYFIGIGMKFTDPNCHIARFNLGTGAEHRPTCHRAFGDTMKAFTTTWPGMHNMEHWLEQFYDSDSESV